MARIGSVNDEYYVFVTTDEQKTAKQIIQPYEIQPEIEEDYRQLKDFRMLETFASTKLAMGREVAACAHEKITRSCPQVRYHLRGAIL